MHALFATWEKASNLSLRFLAGAAQSLIERLPKECATPKPKNSSKSPSHRPPAQGFLHATFVRVAKAQRHPAGLEFGGLALGFTYPDWLDEQLSSMRALSAIGLDLFWEFTGFSAKPAKSLRRFCRGVNSNRGTAFLLQHGTSDKARVLEGRPRRAHKSSTHGAKRAHRDVGALLRDHLFQGLEIT